MSLPDNNTSGFVFACFRVSRKSQITLEFIILAISAIAITLVLLAVSARFFSSVISSKNSDELYDLGQSVSRELFLAVEAGNGYHRVLSLPLTLRARPYSISCSNSTLSLSSAGSSVSFVVPSFSGCFVKGRNIIVNDNGVISVVNS